MAKILFCIAAASAKINARSVRRFLSPWRIARFFIQIACVVGVCTFKHALELLWSVRAAYVSQMHIAPETEFIIVSAANNQIEFDMHGEPFK
jgi:hypothetical protein